MTLDRQRVREIVAKVVDAHVAADGREQLPATSQRATGEHTVAVGADHGGYELKQSVVAWLRDRGWQVEDCGTMSREAVDYPDFARAVAERVAAGSCSFGIVVDGAGIGSAMVANKVPGVRAALCYDISSARNSREHNHANVLTLGAGLVGPSLALQIVEAWLSTPWGDGRHARRAALIDGVDSAYRADSAHPSAPARS